jgi:hypothetical protein
MLKIDKDTFLICTDCKDYLNIIKVNTGTVTF